MKGLFQTTFALKRFKGLKQHEAFIKSAIRISYRTGRTFNYLNYYISFYN